MHVRTACVFLFVTLSKVLRISRLHLLLPLLLPPPPLLLVARCCTLTPLSSCPDGCSLRQLASFQGGSDKGEEHYQRRGTPPKERNTTKGEEHYHKGEEHYELSHVCTQHLLSDLIRCRSSEHFKTRLKNIRAIDLYCQKPKTFNQNQSPTIN